MLYSLFMIFFVQAIVPVLICFVLTWLVIWSGKPKPANVVKLQFIGAGATWGITGVVHLLCWMLLGGPIALSPDPAIFIWFTLVLPVAASTAVCLFLRKRAKPVVPPPLPTQAG
ncbi:hypothetical protein IGB42_01875 [Andreprevotia sp. IGB-42]|uniref:hypothetical protein n=1 Tax=Andreprevotia sp. IGB-42 TaxID=2497473 RepID=UPI001358DFA1|nr:hypothetical protein [Andreprevotia sp. IGB-42]KAF0813524.1 hypothetical protein IGB42_01875 [Andreprevotia sp. IGB-42]